MNNFEQLLTVENFCLAFSRLITCKRDLYKEIYYEDIKIFNLFLIENINSLLNEIREEIYEPENSYKIFIPKKNDLVRPLSLLKFKDLLVYQAIINVISDSVYEAIAPYYNSYIFGNVYNTSNDTEENRKFFYKPWKQQWSKFEQKTKQYHEEGYCFLSEFDIASFFDTIDHYILENILEKEYNIDKKIIKLLLKILESCTSDYMNKCLRSKHGIPQGPVGSAFLADLYLLNLDLEIIKLVKIISMSNILDMWMI
jgi:hypothetical protein